MPPEMPRPPADDQGPKSGSDGVFAGSAANSTPTSPNGHGTPDTCLHGQPPATCQHPACVLVREAPDVIDGEPKICPHGYGPGKDSQGQLRPGSRACPDCRREQARQVVNGQPKLPDRIHTFIPASQVETRELLWLWRHRMPIGEITLLAGRAGLGKSTIADMLAAGVTNGTLTPGRFTGEPKDVLILAEEDAIDYTIVPRLIAAGADMSRVHFVTVERVDPGTGNRDVVQWSAGIDTDNLVRDARAAGLDVALVIIDPLVAVLTGRKRNDGDEIRPPLIALKRMAEHLNANVLALVHFNKGSNAQTALERITGSGEFGNVARSALGVAEDPESSMCVLSNVKYNLAPSGLPGLTYRIESTSVRTDDGGQCEVGKAVITGETEMTVERLMRAEVSGDTRLGEAMQWLREYLTRTGEVPSQQVKSDARKAEGFSPATLKRAASLIGVVPRRRLDHTTTWSLP